MSISNYRLFGLGKDNVGFRDDRKQTHDSLAYDHCPPDEVINARVELDRLNREALERNPEYRMSYKERWQNLDESEKRADKCQAPDMSFFTALSPHSTLFKIPKKLRGNEQVDS